MPLMGEPVIREERWRAAAAIVIEKGIMGNKTETKFKNSSAKQTLNPPGPPGLPFIGNLHQIPSDGILHKFLYKLSNKYGEIMYMKLGSVPIVVVSSPKLAKDVLKTYDHVFCSRPMSLGQQKLSYNNLDIAFSPYNDYWREVRKISTVHLFSSKKVQSFGPIHEDEISRLVAKISGFADTSREANVKEMLTSFTSTLICRVAFGKRYEEEGYERQRFDGLLSEAQALLISFFVSDYIPAFGWVDKLSRMMSGTDTSAATIIWTMTALMKAPNVMKKVQAEIRDLIGNKGKIDEDDLQKLPYLKAVINETFRLYTPNPILGRRTKERCTLEGYEIQPDTVVYVNAWAIARDPESRLLEKP
ncbi:hypothetical protein BUALT_Bualt11G0077400 [Buddleja alternifolia]|uniref:Cytochrome P450 n=1 Tax=Buddleja alternifolia TaxID=168488 RepID=A0AAV6WY49_9LAMI|nr:hypothetical protein BUALT_Bualt11G0077400 [Buddleja alternifolia]